MSIPTNATVLWFNDSKGYGWVHMDTCKDVFVHYTAIVTQGFATLAEGQRVHCELIEGPKGLQACKVLKGELV